MYIPRTLSEKVITLSGFFPAVILSGARQTGKTTLLKNIFPDYNYVSLDLARQDEKAESSPTRFLSEHGTPLIIDEIQYAPGLFRYIKGAIDKDRHRMGTYILTGSQDISLMKHISESLAGRCGIVQLENLSVQEISQKLEVKESADSYLHLMSRGQFPELWRAVDLPAREFYDAYLTTYLERDVRQILNVTSLRDFERFIRILASRSGNMLNKTDIARDVGVSVKAIGDWLSVLEASGQIILLEPWFSNFDKRIVKTPKVYFRETGLLCYLLGLNRNSLGNSAFLGSVWETFVFSELRKINAGLAEPVNFWYYRDQRAREVDFLIQTGDVLSFIECKWTEKPGKSDMQNIVAVSSELRKSGVRWRPGRHYIAANSAASYALTDEIDVIMFEDLGQVLGPE